DEQETYERSLKYYRDLNNVVDTSREEGIEIGEKRGIEIGEQRGIEIGEKRGIEIGEKRGIEIGEQLGVVKGMRSLLIKQLSRKLGELPQSIIDQIHQLSPEALDALSEGILDIDTVSTLQTWLTR
ncbi:MAG: DUF4351 domain-containing protein, partial [Leptolyngbyaceae bacterium]|nr:DUF4351 domain-containing protein [Leptolyngbyaceae bacterium]